MAMRLPENNWARRGLALLAGLLICGSVPPWGWWPCAFVGIALWALLIDRPRWTARFGVGALVGLGWFLPSTIWMVRFTPAAWPLGVSVWFPLVMGTASALCPPGRWRFAVLAATVTASEWFRWHAPFGGVPLSMLAMGQARGPLLPVARIGGSLGVSLAVAAVGVTLGAAIDGSRRNAVLAVIAVAAVAVAGIWAPDGRVTSTMTVAVIQGGGAQQTRSESTDYTEVLQRHLTEAETITSPVELYVFPENIVNVTGFWEGSFEERLVSDFARRHAATVVIGIVEDHNDPEHFYNAAVAVGPDGHQVARYDKVRRVPYGEYVPMRNLLDPIAHDQLPPRDQVPGTGPPVLVTPAGRLGVAVSWEVFFGRRVRDAVHHDAEIILNPTNGSSYWLTQVQTQQIASSTLRAVESGRWVLQSAPTGFSAIIDPHGDVLGRTGIGEPATLTATVERRDGRTIAALTGDLLALLIALVLAIGGHLLTRRSDPGSGRSSRESSTSVVDMS